MSYEPSDVPVARAIAYAPTEQISLRFPQVLMSRRAAIEDMLVVFGVLLCFAVFTHLVDLHAFLQTIVPSGGPYAWVFLNGLLELGAIAIVLKFRGQGPAELGLNRLSGKVFVLGVLAAVPGAYMVGMFCSLSAIALSGSGLFEIAKERHSFLAHISDIPINWVVPVVLFVGLYEEILFRGFLLPRLMALLPGKVLPVAACAVIFGLVHFPQGVIFVAQITGVAVVLTILVVKTRSLWPAIATHAIIDGLSLFIAIKFLPHLARILESETTAPTTMP